MELILKLFESYIYFPRNYELHSNRIYFRTTNIIFLIIIVALQYEFDIYFRVKEIIYWVKSLFITLIANNNPNIYETN